MRNKQRASIEVKQHYRMYKSGKQWLFQRIAVAGAMAIIGGAGVVMTQHSVSASADTVQTQTQTQTSSGANNTAQPATDTTSSGANSNGVTSNGTNSTQSSSAVAVSVSSASVNSTSTATSNSTDEGLTNRDTTGVDNGSQNNVSNAINNYNQKVQSTVAKQKQTLQDLQTQEQADKNLQVKSFTTDKARYNPNDNVNFYVETQNNVNANATANINVQIYHGNAMVSNINVTSPVAANAQSNYSQITWKAPSTDFQGYMAYVFVNGSLRAMRAVDVSSDWTKFPRYGTLTTFKASDKDGNIQRLSDMKDNYVNSVQFYDAYYTSQNPMPTSDLNATFTQNWDPWLSQDDRTKSVNTIHDAVQAGHDLYNIASMYYNMIYAFTGDPHDTNYLKSIGVDPSWILYHAEGDQKDQTFSGDMAPWMQDNKWQYTQTFLNIANPDVQRWAYERIKPLLEYGFKFDGWHGDTIGENGPMYVINSDGSHSQNLYMSDYLGTFANAIKGFMQQDGLGDKKFGVNTVDNKGQISGEWKNTVDKSNADIQYSESWGADLSRLDYVIKQTYLNSGKSLIVPDYVQYDQKDRQGKDININTVLMMDAFVYAAGGSRLENLNGNSLIQGAFFPTQDLKMTDDLKTQFHNYQTFITAYENFLRDGQTDLYPGGGGMALYNSLGQPMAISQPATSNDSKKNSVYIYARTNGKQQTVQMINFNGITDLDPHGNSGNQVAPTEQKNFWLQYYPEKPLDHNGSTPVTSITLLTPDGDNANKPQNIPVEWKQDGSGTWYLNIPVNSLQRWDMIVLSNDGSHNQDFDLDSAATVRSQNDAVENAQFDNNDGLSTSRGVAINQLQYAINNASTVAQDQNNLLSTLQSQADNDMVNALNSQAAQFNQDKNNALNSLQAKADADKASALNSLQAATNSQTASLQDAYNNGLIKADSLQAALTSVASQAATDKANAISSLMAQAASDKAQTISTLQSKADADKASLQAELQSSADADKANALASQASSLAQDKANAVAQAVQSQIAQDNADKANALSSQAASLAQDQATALQSQIAKDSASANDALNKEKALISSDKAQLIQTLTDQYQAQINMANQQASQAVIRYQNLAAQASSTATSAINSIAQSAQADKASALASLQAKNDTDKSSALSSLQAQADANASQANTDKANAIAQAKQDVLNSLQTQYNIDKANALNSLQAQWQQTLSSTIQSLQAQASSDKANALSQAQSAAVADTVQAVARQAQTDKQLLDQALATAKANADKAIADANNAVAQQKAKDDADKQAALDKQKADYEHQLELAKQQASQNNGGTSQGNTGGNTTPTKTDTNKTDSDIKRYGDLNKKYLNFKSLKDNKRILKLFKKHHINTSAPTMKILSKKKISKNYTRYTVKVSGKKVSFTVRNSKVEQSYYEPIKNAKPYYIKAVRNVIVHKRTDFKGKKLRSIKKGKLIKVVNAQTFHGITRFKLTTGGYVTSNKYYVKVVK